MRKLWKTTIVIWSEEDGTKYGMERLALETEDGVAYCSRFESKLIDKLESDRDWDGTDFFGEERRHHQE